ncbi:rhomboid-like protein [Streptomyces gilvosporeus]|uniref:rhomboid-like protein n=1 Tax=Streptomyces gilvosporeus TaxID=553510 RepID=UPI001F2863F9|nr:rhomboid-like protein [Streptomyces gilvosporeus]
MKPVLPGRCLQRPADAVRRSVAWVRAWVRSAPGTHIWLLIIGITSLVVASASEGLGEFLLHRTSSNIHELNEHPVPALLMSGFWIERPGSYLLYVVMFELLHANVERWLGTWRWLLIVGVAHCAATLASQELVLLAIEGHRLPRSMTHVVDIGVSYGLAAAAGVLTYRLRSPWCYGWLLGVLLFFGVPLLTGATFTDFGHAISLVLGLVAWPLTPAGRAAPDEEEDEDDDADGADQDGARAAPDPRAALDPDSRRQDG